MSMQHCIIRSIIYGIVNIFVVFYICFRWIFRCWRVLNYIMDGFNLIYIMSEFFHFWFIIWSFITKGRYISLFTCF